MCNCNKTRQQTASPRRGQAQPTQQSTQGSTQSAPAPKGRTQSFSLQTREGKTLTFGSKLEAEAENVRRGYTGTVRPA